MSGGSFFFTVPAGAGRMWRKQVSESLADTRNMALPLNWYMGKRRTVQVGVEHLVRAG